MTIEIQVNGITDIEHIEQAIKLTGESKKGNRYVMYKTMDANRPHEVAAASIRIEDAEGRGYEVGIVGMTVGSFKRPVLTMSQFHNDADLFGTFTALLTDDRKLQDLAWEDKMKSYQNKD